MVRGDINSTEWKTGLYAGACKPVLFVYAIVTVQGGLFSKPKMAYGNVVVTDFEYFTRQVVSKSDQEFTVPVTVMVAEPGVMR